MATSRTDERWGRGTVDTACPLDCPDSCSLSVTVKQGKVIAIDGSAVQEVTNGYICGKVRRFDRRLYGDDRLLHPAVGRDRRVAASSKKSIGTKRWIRSQRG